jgi:hypothetical protein
MRTLGDGPFDGGRHFQLLRPLLVIFQPLSDPPRIAQHVGHVKFHSHPIRKGSIELVPTLRVANKKLTSRKRERPVARASGWLA